MPSSLRVITVSVAAALICALAVALAVTASNRPAILVTTPTASTSPSTTEHAILTSGDATVTEKPDLAIVSAGVQSDQPSAAAAQSDLASKTARLVARIKALGVPDGDLSTVGYSVSPVYATGGETITSYRAAEQLQVKWHNVDTVGKTLDAIVQEGGATTIWLSFTLNDPKSAQAQARSLAIADAHAKAQAMASAAGVKL
ncbi:MAG TPA: SIMPL domain-containing protein, partial [Candidatus Udaeobacter sp.]|nr:SIMPL domain-containing protein [Candidatus Udaeobacter sp.]